MSQDHGSRRASSAPGRTTPGTPADPIDRTTVLWFGSEPDVRMPSTAPFSIRRVGALSELVSELRRSPATVSIVDLRTAGSRSAELRDLQKLRTRCPRSVVLAMVDPHCTDAACLALEHGAFDVLASPLAMSDLAAVVGNAREFQRLASRTPEEVLDTLAANGFVALSDAMRRVVELVPRLGAAHCHALLVGEQGTGRETVAGLLHTTGRRGRGRFVTVEGGDSVGDLEARLAEADGGTVYLQHLDQMTISHQLSLVHHLTQDKGRGADVRVIAAVEPTIKRQVDEGIVCASLFEVLSLARVDVPPLRERRQDIPLLARKLLVDICTRDGIVRKTITRPATTLMARLPWHRNLRELRGLLERLALWVPGGLVKLEDVLEHVDLDGGEPVGQGGGTSLREAREQFERKYIAATLRRHRGRMPEAARALGMQRTNLYRKLRVLKLSRQGV